MTGTAAPDVLMGDNGPEPAPIDVSVDAGIATVRMNAPKNRNALSARLVDAMLAALADVSARDDVQAVVLGHTGSTFCSGADLIEARDHGMAAGTQRMLTASQAILDLPVPVIAKIDGHVRAGGMGIVAACDIAVAGPKASFAFTEVRLALAPAVLALTVFPRTSSRGASRYMLTGEVFDAAEAARIGLVTVAAEDTEREMVPMLDALRSCSALGLTETKRLTTAALRQDIAAHGAEAAAESARHFASDEAKERMAAFLSRAASR
jgi:enoyl-CoA hydratase